jgi:hypothetical protein
MFSAAPIDDGDQENRSRFQTRSCSRHKTYSEMKLVWGPTVNHVCALASASRSYNTTLHLGELGGVIAGRHSPAETLGFDRLNGSRVAWLNRCGPRVTVGGGALPHSSKAVPITISTFIRVLKRVVLHFLVE